MCSVLLSRLGSEAVLKRLPIAPWQAHVMAESWGLMHESRGEGGRRRLVVWKPSRGCKVGACRQVCCHGLLRL